MSDGTADPPTPSIVVALRGELAEIPPAVVLQILEVGRKTGRLEFHGDDCVGNLWLSEGVPVHAQTPGCAGLEAALAIVSMTRGWFLFGAGDSAPAESLSVSTTELLLEASLRTDCRGRKIG